MACMCLLELSIIVMILLFQFDVHETHVEVKSSSHKRIQVTKREYTTGL